MEVAPLSLAYSHARNAIAETQKANPIAASEEHDLAAGEFANAAKSTTDPEGFRTLRLLEQHHQRLAELLKFKPEVRPTSEDLEAGGSRHDGTLSIVMEEEGTATSKKATESSTRSTAKHAIPLSDSRHHRDLASSIASNLASARGIQPGQGRRGISSPSSPSVNVQNAKGRLAAAATDDRRESRGGARGQDRRSSAAPGQGSSPYNASSSATGRSSRASPTRSGVAAIPPSIVQPGTDDAFTRFYSTVESLGTKLSAALAFTGVPLNSAPATEERTAPASLTKNTTPPTLQRDTSRTTPAGSPEVSRYFSRAALKAAREEGGGPGVAESFYVVPTSGGTMSYAGMLQGHRHNSSLSEVIGEEEFVDASEVPVHASFEGDGYGSSRRTRSRAGSLKAPPTVAGSKVAVEKGKDEVRRELEYWKAMAKDTGERLKAFEMNAQRESIMAASIYRGAGGAARSRHHSPESVRGQQHHHQQQQQPGSAGSGSSAQPSANVPSVPKIPAAFTRSSTGATADSAGGSANKEQKVKELEEELEQAREEMKKCQKENRKLMAVVEKYRKRFEDLKENARERMRVQEEKEKAQQQAREDEDARRDQLAVG